MVEIIITTLAMGFLFFMCPLGKYRFGNKRSKRIYLKYTEYFITNKRFLSIRLIKPKFFESILFKIPYKKQIVYIFHSDIKYYFLEKVEKLLNAFHLNIRVKHNADDLKPVFIAILNKDIELNDKYKVLILQDDKWNWSVFNNVIYRLNNARNKDEISEVLENNLKMKSKEPPKNWKKKSD